MMSLMDVAKVSPAARCRSQRESSYDRSGGNVDWVAVPAGGRHVILDADGPGVVTHLWFALGSVDYNYLRYVSIKAWWDGCSAPSVDCPIGDFFGVGHAAAFKYDSLAMNMVRGSGHRGEFTGMNSYLPMPFARHARIEVVNENPHAFLICYFQVDWLQTDAAALAETGYFHACWRREDSVARTPTTATHAWELARFGCNTDGRNNFLVADLHGRGRFIGMNLSVDNIDDATLFPMQNFGEGDEMIFIDGEVWPPALHGTGTEDYFCEAWGMTGKSGLYSGTSLPDRWIGGSGTRGTCYRFHIPDPLYFRQSLRFTFEHGMNNCQANDMAATAYWYQEAVSGVPVLPPIAARRPRRAADEPPHEEEDKAVAILAEVVNAYYDIFLHGSRDQVVAMGRGLAADTMSVADRLRSQFMAGTVAVADMVAQLAPYRAAIKEISGA